MRRCGVKRCNRFVMAAVAAAVASLLIPGTSCKRPLSADDAAAIAAR